MPHNIKVQKTNSGKRLDVFLASALNISRSKAQRIIKEGPVIVNEDVASAHLIIEGGDIIEAPDIEETKAPEEADLPEIEIIYEDGDALVVNKPSGLTVHPKNISDDSATLTRAVLKSRPEIAGVGDDPQMRPGIVHRLDKDVSGVMIIAKTNKAFAHLKSQFQNRLVEKEYIALVNGKMEKGIGTISFKIARSKRSGKMVARPQSQEGKDAITEYEVLQKFPNATLLSVKIMTGRTHQIRAHFSAIGHPIVGDKLYKSSKSARSAKLQLDRVFLHAKQLTVNLPNGERRAFEAPMPKELQNLLSQLR